MAPGEVHPNVTPLAFLLGTWRGTGRGRYPTIEPFGFAEEIVIEHVGDPFLLYRQSSWAEDGVPLHFERGFLRMGATADEVELCLAHPLGLTEVSHGHLEGTTIRCTTDGGGAVGRSRTGSDVTSLTRRYRVDGDRLRYELDMGTERTSETMHTGSDLRRTA